MITISEVINTNVISVHQNDLLEKVVKIFEKEKISGMPVVDSENKLVGIISDRDLLKYSEDLQVIPLNYIWMTAKDFLKTTVKEIMSKDISVIKKENTLHDAVVLMQEKGINRLPVVDNENILKGIITRTDLLNYLAVKKILF